MRNRLAAAPGATVPGDRARPWLARLSFALVLVAVAVVAAFAEWKSLVMFGVGLAAAAISLTAAYIVLSRRGVLRWLALAVFVATPVTVLVIYAFANLLWVAAVAAAGWLLAGATARAALAEDKKHWRMPEFPATPARHPFLIMNPRSGGGKVVKFDLRQRAEALGAEVFLMDGPGPVDVAAVARQAIAGGADLLGVAGGDGTQALVAGVAAEHDVPFLVITAGTRNHFALDLGLDRADPVACLDALADGVELRVDLGAISGQTFVNNASFGAYAEIVQTPAYRDDKLGTTLDMLPELLQGQRGTQFTAVADGETIEAPQALLVGSNPYEMGDIAGLGRRARLDQGELGVVAVTVASAGEALGLLRGREFPGLRALTARTVVVTSDADRIPVGLDGEAVSLPTPVTCAVVPGALRVRVPRDRPGVPPPRPAISLARLWRLASWRGPRPDGPSAEPEPLDVGDEDRVGQAPDAGRLRTAHGPRRRARPGQGAVRADADLRRGAAGRVVGYQPAGARPGHCRRAGPAGRGARGAGGGVRHQLRPQAVGDLAGGRRAGVLPRFGREAGADRALPQAAPAGRGRRRPGAHRRAARLSARLHVPALGPPADRRPARAAADGRARAAGPAAVLRREGPAGAGRPAFAARRGVMMLYEPAHLGRECHRRMGWSPHPFGIRTLT
jgi:diacylglycerol kinase family enzyme